MCRPDGETTDVDKPSPTPGDCPSAVGSPLADFYSPPRLSILHLFAWTGITAALIKFSMYTDFLSGFSAVSPQGEVIRQALVFIWNAAHGAALTGACVLLFGKLRGQPGRLQPGHWLLLIDTGFTLCTRLVLLAYLVIDKLGWPEVDVFARIPMDPLFLLLGWIQVTRAGIYTVLTIRSHHVCRWRVTFGTAAAMEAISGLMYMLGAFSFGIISRAVSPTLQVVLGSVLFVTVLLDVKRGPRRDWLHWLGVANAAAIALITIAWWVWLMFL